MSKIIRAINAMVSNSDKITEVYRDKNELFFLYNGKHKWSIFEKQKEEGYILYYYPAKIIPESIEELSRMSPAEVSKLEGKYVAYETDEFKTREAKESFGELFLIIKEKLLGIDKVLAEIIDDDEGFF